MFEDPVFPFHEACYALLARSLYDSADPACIDKDVLYKVMQELVDGATLRFDYGGIWGADQFWDSYPGEEVSFQAHNLYR